MVLYKDELNVERISPENKHFFFGYYDISPESPDGKHILACNPPFIDRMPSIGDYLRIGYFESGSNEFNCVGRTTAWNYQEGCRLQWISNTQFIYNVRTDSGFGSEVYDIIEKQIVKVFKYPVYSVSKESFLATSYGFVNNKYNYPHTNDEEKSNTYGDGVYILNLQTGEYKLTIPLISLVSITKTEHCKNWVEYCSFDPTGHRFFIYHRWNDNHGDAGTHLCVGDVDGNIKTLLISRSISHAGWKGSNQITAWCRVPSAINAIQRSRTVSKSFLFKFAKRIYHALVKSPSMRQKITNDAYVTFNVDSGERAKIDNEAFVSDGHCTWNRNTRYMLTDTYPDENKMRNLLLFDEQKNEVYHLGSYYSYPRDMEKANQGWNVSGMRCDLHPKWTEKEQFIYFDSVHEGFRGLYRIDVSSITNK